MVKCVVATLGSAYSKIAVSPSRVIFTSSAEATCGRRGLGMVDESLAEERHRFTTRDPYDVAGRTHNDANALIQGVLRLWLECDDLTTAYGEAGPEYRTKIAPSCSATGSP
jgi:hypothetical protein